MSNSEKNNSATTNQPWAWTATTGVILMLFIPVVWFLLNPDFEPLIVIVEGILATITYFGLKNRRSQAYLDKALSVFLLLIGIFLTTYMVSSQIKEASEIREDDTVSSYGLPRGAKIIETQSLLPSNNSHRTLILWMHEPIEVPQEENFWGNDCIGEFLGDHRVGPTRLSLYDDEKKQIIHTINVTTNARILSDDNFAIPISAELSPYHYKNMYNDPKKKEIQVLYLLDYTGDGRANEFSMYFRNNCITNLASMFGYDENLDKIIQFDIEITDKSVEPPTTRIEKWYDNFIDDTDNLMPGRWQSAVDLRGRGGYLEIADVSFDEERKIFKVVLSKQK